MYFSFFKLKKWGKKTAAARRHNCAPVALCNARLPHGGAKDGHSTTRVSS